MLLALVLVMSVYEADWVKAVDGDTIRLSTEMDVRLQGIDAPELRGKCEEEKVLARAAREALSELVENGEDVRVGIVGTDKYGRSLGNVVVDGIDGGRYLVGLGLAREYGGGKRGSWCR